MKSVSVRWPLLVEAATLVACVTWCLVYAGYVGHIRAGQDRHVVVDLFLVGFAQVNRMDKIGSPLAQLIFANWLAHDSRADLIAGGMLCGTAFGILAGVYFIAWSIERAFRNTQQHAGIKDTLRWISIMYLIGSSSLSVSALGTQHA